jgi:hypothetical protein
MKFKFNQKGGVSVTMMVFLALGVFALIFGASLTQNTGKIADNVKEAFNYEDCDGDGVKNIHDKCAGQATGVKSHSDQNKFRGCPASNPQLENYASLYKLFQVGEGKDLKFYPICEDSGLKDKCVTRKESKNHQTKCQYVEFSNLITAIADASTKDKIGVPTLEGVPTTGGISTASDLKLIRYEVSVGEGNEDGFWNINEKNIKEEKKSVVNLKSGKESNNKIVIKNVGTEKVTKSFKIKIEACNSKRANCFERGTIEVNEEIDVGKNITVSKKITIAEKGDFCHVSTGTGECYYKVTLDSTGQMNEDKSNNIGGVMIVVKNPSSFDGFNKYKAIEIAGDDDGGPDPINSDINQFCSGYIGDGDVFKCDSYDSSCDEGEFPYAKKDGDVPAWNENKGCLIVASEDDPSSEECGYAGAADGQMIYAMAYSKLDNLKTNFVNSDGSNAENLMSWSWRTGKYWSFLCKKGIWYSCDKTGVNEVTAENDYICKSKNSIYDWERYQ